MCNDPLPKTHLDKIMLPIHDIVLALIDYVEGKHHECAMDNIYNSAEFFKTAYNHEKTTGLWCYKEGNERHLAMCYTRGIYFKEGKY